MRPNGPTSRALVRRCRLGRSGERASSKPPRTCRRLCRQCQQLAFSARTGPGAALRSRRRGRFSIGCSPPTTWPRAAPVGRNSRRGGTSRTAISKQVSARNGADVPQRLGHRRRGSRDDRDPGARLPGRRPRAPDFSAARVRTDPLAAADADARNLSLSYRARSGAGPAVARPLAARCVESDVSQTSAEAAGGEARNGKNSAPSSLCQFRTARSSDSRSNGPMICILRKSGSTT